MVVVEQSIIRMQMKIKSSYIGKLYYQRFSSEKEDYSIYKQNKIQPVKQKN